MEIAVYAIGEMLKIHKISSTFFLLGRWRKLGLVYLIECTEEEIAFNGCIFI